MRILLVEDDPHISDVIRRGLSERGMDVTIASDGESGLELGSRNESDLIILDFKLPKLDGTTICKLLRSRGITTPIIMLTALSSSNHIELAYSQGANDYVIKPFDFNDLIARIRALTRLDDDDGPPAFSSGELVIDLTRRCVTRSGRRVNVTEMEFTLLECLLRHPGQIVTRQMLCEALGNIKVDVRSTMIDTLIGILSRNLRSPETPSPIEMIDGEGYRFIRN